MQVLVHIWPLLWMSSRQDCKCRDQIQGIAFFPEVEICCVALVCLSVHLSFLDWRLRVCLVTIFENYFFVLNGKENKENMFVLHVFYSEAQRTQKNTTFNKKEEFLENTKILFSIFSKNILINNLEKQKPNRP